MKTILYQRTINFLAIFTITCSLARAQPVFPKAELTNAKINTAGDLEIVASQSSSPNDFGFLTGKWKMYHQRLKKRLVDNHEWESFESYDENFGSMLNGIGNTDIYKATIDGKPFEGFTLRLFNPKTKLWSLYWVASNTGVLDPPVVGSFEGNIGKFYCKDIYNNKPVIVMFQWDKTDPNNPVWSQAFSPDNGKTWEWNWTNVSKRVN